MAGLDEVSNISEKADRVGESSLYLNEGNKLKLGELIEGALVKSGNDACVAIAEQTAGSLDEFIRLMNLKAVSLGATDSHFVNPHGLPANDHYSSAYDLAVIARYALRNPMFSKFVSEKVATITYEEPQKTQIIKNTNKLLWNYPFADGVKTGTTNAAGKCLIASASKNGRKLISVVLNAPDRFGDAERLMEWGFNQTEIITIGNNGDFVTYYSGSGINIPVALGSDVVLCLPKDKTKELKFQAEFKGGSYPPIHKGDVLGTYNVLIGDTVIKSVQLISDQNYSGNPINFSGTLNLVVDRFLDLLNKKG
jgi:D-alanyl-D-alanine carboxypeptidase (penicillin-binding protein 5/6)